MIDIHTHILPGVDDGSSDLQTTLQHLRLMLEKGVTGVFLTPHFMRNMFDGNPETIRKKFRELKKKVKAENIEIDLYPGFEIYLEPGIHQKIADHKLSLNGTKYILIETNMSGFTRELPQILYDLVHHGWKPILAHPERYSDIINDPLTAEELIHKNLLMQINAGSLLGDYGRAVQNAAWFLVENGFAHFLASDDHCKNPVFNLDIALNEIRENIDEHTANLLSVINPQKVINNEPIEYFYLKEIREKKRGFFSRLFN
ncbi:MAG: CpsB/CapC family capsule biosynthesis tyrosine phosphatase [Candidatus Cloacimonadales bacterium]|nr:CpsB/CapC family capsule biosynthesis tyrosine phosphatase [Candidatus Cloacimonadales bacterium]